MHLTTSSLHVLIAQQGLDHFLTHQLLTNQSSVSLSLAHHSNWTPSWCTGDVVVGCTYSMAPTTTQHLG